MTVDKKEEMPLSEVEGIDDAEMAQLIADELGEEVPVRRIPQAAEAA